MRFAALRRQGLTTCLLATAMAAGHAVAGAPGLAVEGTEFVLRQDDGRVLRSADLVGAELDLGNGTVLRIESVETDPRDADIHLHRLSLRQPDGSWHDACEADAQGQRRGFPLPSRWDAAGRFHADAAHVSLSCTSGARGKCVRFGYKFWKPGPGGAALGDLYEACVHMVRADYCGDGSAHTRDGTLIDVYDDRGVQRSDADPGFRFEAGWAPDGAVCVARTRIPDVLDLPQLAARCPRLAPTLGPACDEASARRQGAVLFNRSRWP